MRAPSPWVWDGDCHAGRDGGFPLVAREPDLEIRGKAFGRPTRDPGPRIIPIPIAEEPNPAVWDDGTGVNCFVNFRAPFGHVDFLSLLGGEIEQAADENKI